MCREYLQNLEAPWAHDPQREWNADFRRQPLGTWQLLPDESI